MAYLHLFETINEFNSARTPENYNEPWISFTRENSAVTYNKSEYEKLLETPLTTIARENGTISFNIWRGMGTDYITSISYSTDDGQTWTTTQNQNNKSEHLVIDVNVNEGDKVLWKGIAQQTGYFDEDDYVGSFFSSTAEFDVEGNIMSLLYGDNFIGEVELEYDYQFVYLFSDYDEEKECSIVNAKNLILPATTLASNCYSGMFYGCTNLTSAPELPATTLANSCYSGMFHGCTSLTSVPAVLPATALANFCYNSMFSRCTNLTSAPELPATSLVDNCYNSMFRGCTNLTMAPALPATTLADSCYSSMFGSCTSLTTAPELPATTLALGCYGGMFNGCTSLTTAPELPATTLAVNCYYYMFSGCTSLASAPELPATTLADGCYYGMFISCTNLNYIKCLATDISASNCTNNWVYGVSSTGTFVTPQSTSWTTGNNGIPANWTRVNA